MDNRYVQFVCRHFRSISIVYLHEWNYPLPPLKDNGFDLLEVRLSNKNLSMFHKREWDSPNISWTKSEDSYHTILVSKAFKWKNMVWALGYFDC